MKSATLMGGPVLVEALEDQRPAINYRRLETVLVIEDHPDLGRALALQLEAAGLNVALARDGIEGLEKIWLLEPDLIVLDIHLPRLHGFRLLERLRMQPNLKDTPILAITGDPDPEIESRAEQWGIRGFYRKPVRRKVFVKAALDILAGF